MENKEALILVFQDLIDLIERAENRRKEWNTVENSNSIAEQWEEIKLRYTLELMELLKPLNLPLQLVED